MEDAFLVCFFAGLFFTVISAFLAGISGGHGHDGAESGVDADAADIAVGDVDVGDLDIGHAEAGDFDVGHAEIGDLDAGHMEASPSAEFDMGHDFDHAIADAGGDGHVEVGIADGFPGLSAWSPTVISSFVTTFGAVGYICMREAQAGIPLSVLSGIVGGFSLAFFVFWGMNKVFSAVQGSSMVRVAGLKGRKAEVITPILEGGVGEISYEAQGTRLSAPARSVKGKAVARGAIVKIVRITKTVYYVKPV
jgi:hypothetical protein